jgi:hypothetical protein
MRVRFLRGKDKPDTLTCTRRDGSQTWSRLTPGFGPHHDLTHFVVETSLGLRRGFYGLVASGRAIDELSDTQTLGPAGPEALLAEMLVSALQSEATGVATADDFAARLTSACAGFGITPPEIAPSVLEAMRDRMRALWQQWQATTPGRALELDFPDA